MQPASQLPPDDSNAGRRAYDRRYQHALQGWVSSRMRSQARQRRKGRTPIRSQADQPNPPR
jgi:hypothetical protein